MIVILYSDGTSTLASQVATDVSAAFKSSLDVTTIAASSPGTWPTKENWDDLLVILYDDQPFPSSGNDFINRFVTERSGRSLMLPVATAGRSRPPADAEQIKAFEFDATAAGVDGSLVRRAGAMVGLRLQKRENVIFISYRATDGRHLAVQIEDHLKSLGYPVWRDEAKELDGSTKILPGNPVQSEIDRALEKAAVVLLLDTPRASESIWINHEVDTANGLMIPVLPVCFRASDDRQKGPRFASLLQLQRWVDVRQTGAPIDVSALNSIVSELETYLSEIVRRRCRVPFIVEREFTSRQYSWNVLDPKLMVSESKRVHNARLTTRVLSHCSIFDHVYGPALDRFSQFLSANGRCNHSLYIYDGELIPEAQLKGIVAARPADEAVVILHHQELSALIDSNFTAFSP